MMDEGSRSPLEDALLDTVEYALINLVRHYPELYNPQDPGNRDKGRRDAAWADISRQLNKDESWCYTKWRNLSDYYKKRRKIYENGGPVSTSSLAMKRWVYYDAMNFLDLYETSSRADFSSNVNLVNISELSSGSSRSASEHNGNNGGGDAHHNYFDETQYHSLDGIAERAAGEIKLNQYLDPIIESQPPQKKQRVATNPTRPERDKIPFGSLEAIPTTSSALFSNCRFQQNGLPNGGLDGTPGIMPSIVSVHSKALMTSSSHAETLNGRTSKSQNTADKTASSDAANTSGTSRRTCEPVTPSSNEDCPHFHFCNSLAARFRNMDPATATYLQMKIMELFLKTEYPVEYKRQLNHLQDN